MTRQYISVVETAKLIRIALKKAFPNTKFSVKSDKYAGGASIRVGWTDGPSVAKVDMILDPFEGAGFDGMIDMKYNKTSFLDPKTGFVMFGNSPGTEGSGGVYEKKDVKIPDGMIEVSFGADYIFTERNFSPKKVLNGYQAAIEKWGEQQPVTFNEYGYPVPDYFHKGGDAWISTLIYREISTVSYF